MNTILNFIWCLFSMKVFTFMIAIKTLLILLCGRKPLRNDHTIICWKLQNFEWLNLKISWKYNIHHAYAGKKIFHKKALIGEFTFPAKPLSFSEIFTMNSVIFILVFFPWTTITPKTSKRRCLCVKQRIVLHESYEIRFK